MEGSRDEGSNNHRDSALSNIFQQNDDRTPDQLAEEWGMKNENPVPPMVDARRQMENGILNMFRQHNQNRVPMQHQSAIPTAGNSQNEIELQNTQPANHQKAVSPEAANLQAQLNRALLNQIENIMKAQMPPSNQTPQLDRDMMDDYNYRGINSVSY